MTHCHLPLTPQWVQWPYPWVWILVALALLPLCWWLWQRPSWRPALRFSDLGPLRAAGARWSSGVRRLLPALRLAALGCLIVAVARPQRPDESNQVFAEGIAIQMIVDDSGSMDDPDLAPREQMTRLDVVKEVFRRFVQGDGGGLPGRPNDLIGMIRFAMYPDSVCPLTLDHRSLIDALEQIHIVSGDENSTAIGDALALGVSRLKDLTRTSGSGQQYAITSRVIVLLTDGEQNAGSLSPEQAGELAATYGIRIYTILAGTGVWNKYAGYHHPIDDRPLKNVAELTGGRFYHAQDRNSLLKIYEEIDKLERTKTEERRFVRWGELARPWLVAAFACLCLQVLLDSTLLRKIP